MPHRPAEEFAVAAGERNLRLRPGECRADRGTETFAEADRYGGERLGPSRGRNPRRCDGVPQSRAVEVHRHAGLRRPGCDGSNRLERVDRAAAAVVCVLQPDQPSLRAVDVGRGELFAQGVERKNTVSAVERPDGHAAQRRRGTALPQEHVARPLGQNLFAGGAVQADGNLVGHAAGRHEDRGVLAQDFGDAGFERVDRRVFAVHIVADRGREHRLPHGRRRAGDGVATQVDHGGHSRSRVVTSFLPAPALCGLRGASAAPLCAS